MKKIFKIVLISILLLIITSILSYSNQLHVDGLKRYGLPFYNYQSCGDCVEGFESGFVYENIIKNIIIYGLITTFVMYVTQKMKK